MSEDKKFFVGLDGSGPYKDGMSGFTAPLMSFSSLEGALSKVEELRNLPPGSIGGRFTSVEAEENSTDQKQQKETHLNIFKPSEIAVYDNLYCKPTQINCPTVRVAFSMSVIFLSGNGWQFGQYNFGEGTWETLPTDEKRRSFKDRDVECWFYPPGTVDAFKRYAEDVKSGRCRDDLSRLDEYHEKE